jgi:small subunit ribosomal protein S3e
MAAAAAAAAAPTPATQISKKRKLIADGVFFAEINQFFERELGEAGYSGVEVRVTPLKTEIILRATKTQAVVGEKNRRIQELTSLVQKRFNFPEGNVQLYVDKVQNHALSSIAQCESLRFKLLSGLPVRRACYGVLRYIMDNGAKGVEIVISGKLRGARAKAMKFRDGYMVKSGHGSNVFVDYAVRNILLKQGILGIRVSIMLPQDPDGKARLSDYVHIKDPKGDEGVSSQPKTGYGVDAQTGGTAAGAGTTATGGAPTGGAPAPVSSAPLQQQQPLPPQQVLPQAAPPAAVHMAVPTGQPIVQQQQPPHVQRQQPMYR